MFFWIGDKVCCAYRTVGISGNISVKAMPFFTNLGNALINPLPSLHPLDTFVGFMTAVIAKLVLEYKRKHRKKYAEDKEYGSARWGNAKDIEPYMDRQNFDNNVLLTQTERITMGKPSNVKYARNQNVLVVGGSGSGKTRFYVKPNLMQMHSSYVVTDPKGTVLVECGKMLQKGKPVVKNGKIIVAGILIGPYCLNLVPGNVIGGMDFIADIALAFIAFSTGEFFKFDTLKKSGGKVMVITVFEAILASVLVFIITFFVLGLELNFSIVLAALASATAPASTVMTIRQTHAKGDFVDTLLQVVALDDIFLAISPLQCYNT